MTCAIDRHGLMPIDQAFNVATLHMANRTNPLGWDVVDGGPSTHEELCQRFRETGRIVVDSWAPAHSIYEDREIWYARMAWHDRVHYEFGLPFDLDGEINCYIVQAQQMAEVYDGPKQLRHFLRLLYVDIVGQNQYCASHGHMPQDPRAFYFAYECDERAAIRGTNWNPKACAA